MKLSKQVTSLKLSRKLKELGVKQESLFYWYFNSKDSEVRYIYGGTPYDHEEDYKKISAYTASELGEILTKRYEPWSSVKKPLVPMFHGGKWVYMEDGKIVLEAKTEADARAKMLIYLLEKELIDLEEVKDER